MRVKRIMKYLQLLSRNVQDLARNLLCTTVIKCTYVNSVTFLGRNKSVSFVICSYRAEMVIGFLRQQYL